MVANLTLIIAKQLDPPPLAHIQLLLVKNMLKALVVRVDNTLRAIQVLGLKRLHGFLKLLLLSAAGEKITTVGLQLLDYNCLKTFYSQEDKDELKR
ncbi:hypothetical protein Tco_0068469 [Tanacetum coccineum]